MESVVRFSGMVDDILNELVSAGYFKTKSEAIRAGVLELGKEYKIIDSLREDLEYAKEFDSRIKSGKIELGTEDELRKIIAQKKRE